MGNLQGSYAFLSLRTGRKITQSQFKELPTPPHVTRWVIAMAIPDKQQKGLVFKDLNWVELPNTYEDSPSDGTVTGVVPAPDENIISVFTC